MYACVSRHCGTQRPQLLLLDSHCSHEVLGLLEEAKRENITIMAIPPHTTHWLQPLDKSIFGPLSASYNRKASAYMASSPTNTISHQSWPSIFKNSWEQTVCAANIISGFRKCGVCPLNPLAVPDDAYAPGEAGSEDSDITLNVLEEQPTGGGRVITLEEMVHLLQSGATLTELPATIPDETPEASLPEQSVSWMAAVHDEFHPQASTSTLPSTSTSTKKVTSHRILTSSEIIAQKRMIMEEKEKKEKQERKRKREVNAKLKQKKSAVHVICAVCLAPETGKEEGIWQEWVACDGCDAWLHMCCVPPRFRRGSLEDYQHQSFLCPQCYNTRNT